MKRQRRSLKVKSSRLPPGERSVVNEIYSCNEAGFIVVWLSGIPERPAIKRSKMRLFEKTAPRPDAASVLAICSQARKFLRLLVHFALVQVTLRI